MRYLTRKFVLLILISSSLFVVSCASSPKKEETTKITEEPQKTTETQTFPQFVDNHEEIPVQTIQTEGDTTEYKIGDITVIHRPTPDNDVVSAQLLIDGGTLDYPKDKAGITLIAQSVATSGGTKSTSRKDFNIILDQSGSTISSFQNDDASGYQLTTLSGPFFDNTWELFRQAIFEPAMPEAEIQNKKEQLLGIIATRLDDPDSHVSHTVKDLMFQNHPYANLQTGTEQSVKPLTRDEIVRFQQQQLDPSKMILVVVGNIPSDELIQKVKDSFGQLKGSHLKGTQPPKVTSKPNTFTIIQKSLPTHYIFGFTEAPSISNKDFYPFLLASAYLRNKLFEEIRTKRNMTYAVSSGVALRKISYAYLYVTAVKPVETMHEIFKVIKNLQDKPITQDELTRARNTYITNVYMGLEGNQNQANLLAQRHMLTGDWRESNHIVEKLEKVTPKEIQDVAKKYLKDYRFAVVGPSQDLPPSTFKQGE